MGSALASALSRRVATERMVAQRMRVRATFPALSLGAEAANAVMRGPARVIPVAWIPQDFHESRGLWVALHAGDRTDDAPKGIEMPTQRLLGTIHIARVVHPSETGWGRAAAALHWGREDAQARCLWVVDRALPLLHPLESTGLQGLWDVRNQHAVDALQRLSRGLCQLGDQIELL